MPDEIIGAENRMLRWRVPLISLLLVGVAYQWIFCLPNDGVLEKEVRHFPIAPFETNYYYLAVNGLALLFPFLLSFDKKVAFYKKWRKIFPAILKVGLVFLVWDVFFTMNHAWGFNPPYLSGISLFHLPLGEWLFFLTVPYACTFIHVCLGAYFPNATFEKTAGYFYPTLTVLLILSGAAFFGKVYFSGTAWLTAAFLLHSTPNARPATKGRFILTYAISLAPFLLINGMLTGLLTQEPVVMYNPEAYSGIRILSVPLDDAIYSFLLLWGVVVNYE